MSERRLSKWEDLLEELTPHQAKVLKAWLIRRAAPAEPEEEPDDFPASPPTL